MKEYKLKSDEIIKLTELKGGCIASNKITIDGLQIGYMYRENPSNEFDSGWRFFAGSEDELKRRKNALSAIENRLVNTTEDQDLRDMIEAFDFDLLFYQDLSTDTDWLPDFTKKQPFSNKLAKPVWHWKNGFIE